MALNPSGITSVPHYYGDVVRWLFMTAAAVILLTHPFYANMLRIELPFTLAGAVILVALAALTNPHNKGVIAADVIAAGVGMVIYQGWALSQYDSSTILEFALRQVVAVLFMASLYFSLKTLRAMVLGKIGRKYEPGEFSKDADEEEVVTKSEYSMRGRVDHHHRAEREKELDIMDDADDKREDEVATPTRLPPQPRPTDDGTPVNEFITRAARARNLDIDTDNKAKDEEYEERRRAQIAADKARRDKELEDLAAGRQ